METTEAELHGWPAAPYRSKAEVDASYARLIDVALRPEHAKAVRIGLASHNLFHLSWALDVATARGVLDQIESRCSKAWRTPSRSRLRDRSKGAALCAGHTGR